ncbi:MAG: hypothetical protein KTR16_01880 [Acidiferrobacterales bacterium]|nr:hypothetical protein [Acidiferrobacterales bacterium]
MDTSLNNEDFFSQEYDRTDDIVCSEKVEHNDSIYDRLKQITSVSEVLRIFGACAVIASMSIFLLNGWTDGNDINRYLKLLAQTGLLTGAGLTLSFVLKENKGARLFFGLSLISVVANFTILGALTYSMFQLDGGLINYPSIVTWKAVSAATFWPVFAGSVTLLAILTRFSFSIFARNIAGPLSLSFLALSTLLMVPVRSSIAVSIIAIVALYAAVSVIKRLSKHDKVVLTNETKFAFGLLLIPGLLIITRALSLYHVDAVMLLTLSGLGYFSVRSWLASFTKPSTLHSVLEKGLFGIAIFCALQVAEILPNAIFEVSGAIFSIVVVALSIDQIKQARTLRWQSSILNLTTAGLVIINVCMAIFSSALLLQISSLLVCVGLLLLANNQALLDEDNRFSKVTALLGIIACLLLLASNIFAMINLGNWMVIGLLGATLIIGGSLYERYGLSFTSKLN